MTDHQKSLLLETAGRRALGVNSRGHLGGVIDADFIDIKGGAFVVLVASLAPYYKNGDFEVQAEINQIIEQFHHLWDRDISNDEYNQGILEARRVLVDFLERHNE